MCGQRGYPLVDDSVGLLTGFLPLDNFVDAYVLTEEVLYETENRA